MKSNPPRRSVDASSPTPLNVYEIVTQKLLELLGSGHCPWRKPGQDTPGGLPANAISKRVYRGANTWILGSAPYSDNRWLSYKQARELGGSVRKGERSTVAVFWKLIDQKDDSTESTGRCQKLPILRYYSVFNAEQCDDLQLPPLVRTGHHNRIEAAEEMIRSMPQPPAITESGSAAWYMPASDRVNVPPLDCFESSDAYYATLFHELGHSTGHETRLARKEVREVASFGSAEYSTEELVAELTSAYCCAAAGLDNSLIQNSAGYLQGWLAALSHDPRMFVLAASRAQRAADFIMAQSMPSCSPE
jgi:antirestriction protein ArdC